VCALIFGRLGDATHRSRLIVAGLAFWAIATGMVSVATGLITLIVIRGLVAAGEATYYPTAAALISDWHRSGTRSRALSIHQTGVFAGAGVGAVTAGALADAFGWRSPFLIFGIIALIFCTVLFKWLRDAPAAPSQHVASTAVSSRGPLRTVLRRPAALMLCMVFFLANGAVCGIIVWLGDAAGADLRPVFEFDSAGVMTGWNFPGDHVVQGTTPLPPPGSGAKHRGMSDIEFRRGDVYQVGALAERFDLVLFMGVLYHLRHPLLALDLIREHVAADLLLFQSMQRGSRTVFEPAADYDFKARAPFNQPGWPKLHFIEHAYSGDPTNWWIPNRACTEAMLRSAGFTIVAHPEAEVYLCGVAERPSGDGAVYPARGAPP